MVCGNLCLRVHPQFDGCYGKLKFQSCQPLPQFNLNVNFSLKISLSELHVGACHTVAALSLEENKNLESFLLGLKKSNPQAFKSLITTMRTISSVPRYRNERKFKQVKGVKNLYEIKVPGVRLYCFQETLEGLPQPSLIIAAYGRAKPKSKQQKADIFHASKIRDDYFRLKEQEDEIDYKAQSDDED